MDSRDSETAEGSETEVEADGDETAIGSSSVRSIHSLLEGKESASGLMRFAAGTVVSL